MSDFKPTHVIHQLGGDVLVIKRYAVGGKRDNLVDEPIPGKFTAPVYFDVNGNFRGVGKKGAIEALPGTVEAKVVKKPLAPEEMLSNVPPSTIHAANVARHANPDAHEVIRTVVPEPTIAELVAAEVAKALSNTPAPVSDNKLTVTGTMAAAILHSCLIPAPDCALGYFELWNGESVQRLDQRGPKGEIVVKVNKANPAAGRMEQYLVIVPETVQFDQFFGQVSQPLPEMVTELPPVGPHRANMVETSNVVMRNPIQGVLVQQASPNLQTPEEIERQREIQAIIEANRPQPAPAQVLSREDELLRRIAELEAEKEAATPANDYADEEAEIEAAIAREEAAERELSRSS